MSQWVRSACSYCNGCSELKTKTSVHGCQTIRVMTPIYRAFIQHVVDKYFVSNVVVRRFRNNWLAHLGEPFALREMF